LKALDTPGYIGGLHHSSYIPAIRKLKAAQCNRELEALLLRLVAATEEESTQTGLAVTSSYYRELARVYRKAHETDKEYAILLRVAKQTQSPGRKALRLRAQMLRARAERLR
jgi:hypothetical protein